MLSRERNLFFLSSPACFHMCVVDSLQALPSLWRLMQFRQTLAGMLYLMPSGRSQALGALSLHACLSMCMCYCLENFICAQSQKFSGMLSGTLASFHLQLMPSYILSELQCTKGNKMHPTQMASKLASWETKDDFCAAYWFPAELPERWLIWCKMVCWPFDAGCIRGMHTPQWHT